MRHPQSSHTDEPQRQRILDAYRIVDSLPEAAFEDIVDVAAATCATPIALVSLIDRERQWFKARRGLDDRETSRMVAVCDHAMRAGALLEIPDLARDARFHSFPVVTGQVGARFYAGMPLVTPEGAAIGTVCVVDVVPRTLTDLQRNALTSLTHLTMHLIDGRRREQEQLRASALEESLQGDPHVQADYTVVSLELQDLAALADRIGERTAQATLRQLQQMLQRCLEPARGDTLDRIANGGEFIAVLHGSDDAERLRKLQDIARQQSELGPAMLMGAARPQFRGESSEAVFKRAEAALGEAKDIYRRLPHQ